ncbi:hypothetical protein [Neisseria sp.]|uniref:hypothetical protein n=1 Tax=Neisseria sp. TaxID=192066 RepID=UPI0026DCE0A5|nr:hypothetical protein [Neisseria sp.]MDO4225918.1 hypothetical protein [Neisseria sp.]
MPNAAKAPSFVAGLIDTATAPAIVAILPATAIASDKEIFPVLSKSLIIFPRVMVAAPAFVAIAKPALVGLKAAAPKAAIVCERPDATPTAFVAFNVPSIPDTAPFTALNTSERAIFYFLKLKLELLHCSKRY